MSTLIGTNAEPARKGQSNGSASDGSIVPPLQAHQDEDASRPRSQRLTVVTLPLVRNKLDDDQQRS